MTKEKKFIKGSGGGGQEKPRQPSRAPDTLNSRQFATVQDLFCEGEIEGYATPSRDGITDTTSTEYGNAKLKDIFLDDTPIVRALASNSNPQTSDFNFKDVTIQERFGTANQTRIGGIQDRAGTPESVNATVTKSSGGVIRQVQAAGAGGINPSAIRITITFPQIQNLRDNGDLEGSTVRYQIFVEYNNAGYPTTPQVDSTVSGRTGDRYQRNHRIDIEGSFPLNIKVVRVTDDSTTENLKNEFEWSTLEKLFDVVSTYANTAYNQIRIDSKQFSSFPVRKYRLRGTKIRIPGAGANNSGTPTVDSNTGRIIYPANYLFNGTMQAATWCSCPSMAMLDILTTVRYGFGDHINDDNLDLFSFVEASKYANEEVDDMTGVGTKEARFSCNVVIQAPNEAFDIINELASVMRCNPIWSNGSLMLAQDRPTDVSYLFNLANVDSNGFSYTGASLKQRHTVISVAYYNMDAQDVDYEVVEDADGIAKFGSLVKQVKAFGCTSRGQAQRYGKSVLFSEQQESELVTFNTSLDAALLVRPGSVIEVNDPVRAGGRRGGRVVAATSSTITIDALAETTLSDLSENLKISVLLPDGNVETGNVSNIIGAIFTVDSVTRFDGTTSTTFSQVPDVNSPFLLTSDDLQTQKFRVISVEETDGVNYTIQAITYLDGKYANIEEGVVLPTLDISNLDELKDPPQNLTAIDKIAVINSQAVAKIFVSWKPVEGVTQYQVNYRKENGNFTSATVLRPDFEILNSEEAKYEIEVYSYNATLKLSASPSSITHNATGKSAIPSDVQNLSIEPVSQGLVRLRWDKSDDADVIHGGRVYIRHSNKTDGSGSFQNSTDLVRAIAGSSTEAVVPSLEGEYILKFQDDGGRFSAGEASVIVDLPDTTKELIVKDQQEQTGTPFNGSKTNVSIVNSNTLQLTNPATNSTGSYEFASTLDLEHTYSLTLKKHIQTVSFYSGNDIDDRTANIDTWRDFDGGTANDTNVQTLVRTTTGDPSGSPTYTSYNQFANGTFRARAFQFKLILSSDDPAQNVTVQQAGFKAIFEVRTETPSSPIASGTSAKSVTFDNAFFTGTSSLGGSATAYLPSIGITIQNAQFNDHFAITNVSATGFTIEIKNSNSFVNRNFTYQAVGYGKRV